MRRGSPKDVLPDVRDGLNRRERAVLLVLSELQAERNDGLVPMTLLHGRVVERVSMSVAELQAIVGRFTGRQLPTATATAIPSPMGPLTIVTDGNALTHVHFPDDPAAPPADGSPSPSLATAFAAYFAGNLAALDVLTVAPVGSAFELAVWQALRCVPAGQTATYAEVARALGKPAGASRAVGQASGKNPVPIVVPCHRVIAAGGKLGGFSGGLARKRWLLAHEQRHAAFKLTWT